jgi:hypothetical protein
MLASRLAKLHEAVDRQTAVCIRIVPRQAGGVFAPGADTTRAVAEITAYVTETSRSVITSGNAANSGHNPNLLGAIRTVRFTTSLLPYAVQGGDLVEFPDDPAAPPLRVSSADPLGTNRTILMLVKTAVAS